VLSRFFHQWERRLASATKDRVVRPFDWGLDWISYGSLHGWVDEVMGDTGAFFAVPPVADYEFNGSRGELRFPSALSTPHAANNTVLARWFPAADERAVSRNGTRGRAVVVLPQWNSDAEGHVGLSRLLARCGVSALRLSLPYHDARMPPELTRADYIVSANIARTVQVCRQAVLDARRAIAWLSLQGYERIGILGTSLGSCLAMLTSAHEPRIRAQALNHVSPWFADVVWRGLSTRHVRESLEGNVTLDVYARYDLTFPVDLSRVLVAEFKRRKLPHEVAVLPCGHYSTGIAPFSYLDAYLLIRFLRRNL
jgi:dienelactone hydrolase